MPPQRPSAPGRPLTDAQRAAIDASTQRMLKRARERRRVGRYRLQTALILPLVGLLRLLPVEAASNLGGWIGRTFVRRIEDLKSFHRTIRVAFPQMGEAEMDELLAEMSANVGRVLGESIHLEAFAGADNARLELSGVEHVEAARREGRGILFVGGHFANWELFEVALANLGLSGAKVLQHPSNPFVLGLVARHRYAYGLDEQIATGEGVFARVRDALRAGRVVQMLADQRTSKGAKVPFFGLETTTNLVPARAARETDAPMIMMSMRRLGPARFAIGFSPPRRYGPDDDEVAIMAEINRFFEEQLRATPAHWLWGHPRWGDVFENIPAQPLVTPPSGR
ncbi:MAG: lysophospholipid acyltransferase family protein [Devosia sp.]|uniref:lysophospholipid acyltransferase family protein n=1 Tax=Devosia sp. TaxID=1871048 RepID=UPI001A50FEB7|nr:lysophospholipid acyltransferase family protein [Devosia sp.]MBL8597814.1 lysophospholipid acyltransferase family protein [Devosia sp.]